MIAITLNFLAKSIQKELNDFFEHVMQKTENVSKQAYSEARFNASSAFKGASNPYRIRFEAL